MAKEPKSRTRRGKLSTFFPADDPLSALVVAFALRADELRTIAYRYDDAFDQLGRSNKDTAWAFLLLRMKAILVLDAGKVLRQLLVDERFLAPFTATPARVVEFADSYERLLTNEHAVDHVRNRMLGHSDQQLIQHALEDHADDVVGAITISSRADLRNWEILHALHGCMLNRKRRKSIMDAGPTIASLREATIAVFELEGLVIWAFDAARKGALFEPA
jgi:hypothetical protein